MSSTSKDRKVLIHYHIFKNAGSSIERSLHQQLGETLHRFETDRADGHLHHGGAHDLIMANPELRAITSHQLHPPMPSGPYQVFPLLFLREPISRVRSAYLFEWQRQLGLDEPKGTLSEYVSLKLDTKGPGVISDFQVFHLAKHWLQEHGLPLDDTTSGYQFAVDFIRAIPTFGLVERFRESADLVNQELRLFYEHDLIQLDYRHDNVTQGAGMSVATIHQVIQEELGDDLFAELLARNQRDIRLHAWATDQFNQAATKLAGQGAEQKQANCETPSSIGTIEVGSNRWQSLDTEAETVSSAKMAQLTRRVTWQDKLLADISDARKSEGSKLVELQAKFQDVEEQLAVRKSLAAIPDPIATVTSKRGRLLRRFERKLATVGNRYQTTQPVDAHWTESLRVIAASGLFDPDFYAEQNPDVTDTGANPLEHYLRHGGTEGRPASRRFHSGRYLRQYPDVGQADMNPLLHYIAHGRSEGRQAFDLDGEPVEREPVDLPQPGDFAEICQGLSFTEHSEVDVSIIIPIYNAIDYTLACLETVRRLRTSYSYEVIVMDDCSDDPQASVLKSIAGLRYIRNDTNLGFLKNCNRGAEMARGRFVVFLNNDTKVDENWLDPLVDTLVDDPSVGLVGSKLVYPDGRLQEAGGIIFQDGSGWNYGRLQDSEHPAFNYLRDVDYISGASIMIEREYFDRLGKFDEAFAPAYYEDTDLCFQIRSDGRRVVYQPLSSVVHFEGISSGTDLTSGVKMHQEINRHTFAAKWADTLQSDHLPGPEQLDQAADPRPKGHVLVIDSTTPTPDQDSGSIDMFNLLRIVNDLGYRAHHIPADGMRHEGRYTRELQRMGVHCVHAPYYQSPTDYLDEVGDIFDLVIMARANVATNQINHVLMRCPSARTVFYTVDLHFLRLEREAELLGDRRAAQASEQIRERELAVMDLVDTTVVLSETEQKLLHQLGKSNISVIPLIRHVSDTEIAPFEQRAGAVFVGGFRHPPNIDAVEWLVSDIWPLVTEKWKAATGSDQFPLRIIGSNIPRRFHRTDGDIEVYGFVENLEPILSQSLLTVAPLRYGAGLKGKIATSFEFGLPVVGTSVAFEGMPDPGRNEISVIADDAEAFASKVIEVASSADRWHMLSQAGRSYLRSHYSIETITPKVAALFGPEHPMDSAGHVD